MVFGGNKIFYKDTKFDPFKYRQRIKSMPGFFLDLDEFQRNKKEDACYYPKFSFVKSQNEGNDNCLIKNQKEKPHLMKLVLENLII